MGKPQNFDPPPPYSAADFHQAATAPQYVPGAAPQYMPGAPPQYMPNAAPPTFQQPMPQQAAPVVVHQIVHVAAPQVGPVPTTLNCPSCHDTIRTSMNFEISPKTHLVCLILCLLQCYPCCLLPYCIGSCQNAIHSCPKCGAYIGTYRG